MWNYYKDKIDFVDNASQGKSFKYTIKIIGKMEGKPPQPPVPPDGTDWQQWPPVSPLKLDSQLSKKTVLFASKKAL